MGADWAWLATGEDAATGSEVRAGKEEVEDGVTDDATVLPELNEEVVPAEDDVTPELMVEPWLLMIAGEEAMTEPLGLP